MRLFSPIPAGDRGRKVRAHAFKQGPPMPGLTADGNTLVTSTSEWSEVLHTGTGHVALPGVTVFLWHCLFRFIGLTQFMVIHINIAVENESTTGLVVNAVEHFEDQE